tara:strand:- start:204 stop:563 length:360 start_codon:yes stop_codon:yes gene_type:complete
MVESAGYSTNDGPTCSSVTPAELTTNRPQGTTTCYNYKVIKGTHPMQITSKRHSMVVEFRPHNILTDKFVYTLKFKDQAMSMRLMTKREMNETIESRLDKGYEVTDILTEPQAYFPAAC